MVGSIVRKNIRDRTFEMTFDGTCDRTFDRAPCPRARRAVLLCTARVSCCTAPPESAACGYAAQLAKLHRTAQLAMLQSWQYCTAGHIASWTSSVLWRRAARREEHVCACACKRACVRACKRSGVRARVRSCERASLRACVRTRRNKQRALRILVIAY